MDDFNAFCPKCGKTATVELLQNGTVMHVVSLPDGKREDHTFKLSTREIDNLRKSHPGLPASFWPED